MTYRPRFTCERCGSDLDAVDITTMGDAEPKFLPLPCACPGPRCGWCHKRLDENGACPSLPVVECAYGGLLIPLPEFA